MILYRVAVFFIRIYIKIIGCRVVGAQHVPKTGSCIIAANHINYFDPFFLVCAIPRILHFIGKATLFRNPIVGWVLKKLGAFPVSRDGEGDISAIRRCMAILKENNTLAIFPEGTRSATGEMNQALDGVGLIAERSRAPIVPVRIIKLKKGKWGRHKTRIHIGPPLLLHELTELPDDKRLRRKAIAITVMEKIAAL
ncbi:MAG: 1-acyl-sn-glycerol-3-phosphate acyltransferase [Peptococcaceae bacterium]|nr:1-acyl-sn-glycerol-3-phosphate acyltransferase [Peptococcaceae bacterium]